ncbi:MAG: peptidylprolyl isomerase [Rhodospirillaceae bacterium]|nr:peptidylprolyl isomerase [Rhodospirillales bacterium]
MGTAVSAAPPNPPSGVEIVAKVDGLTIDRTEFEAAAARASRQKFYHGKVDDAKLAEFRREQINEIITERLLMKEAERRKLRPDLDDVERKLAEYETRYKDSEQWAANRARILPELKARMIENSQRAALEREVRAVPPPSKEQLEKYHRDNAKLFTEPERDHLTVILLKVDPSSTKDVWASAFEEAERIRQKIKSGTDFGELAKLHSADESAARGGDMGYMHHGMLAPAAQAAIDTMKVGDISEPVELLQGYGLFKLVDRKPATLRPLDQVSERALDLYRRQKGDESWAALAEYLRKKATIWISPDLTPTAAAAAK